MVRACAILLVALAMPCVSAQPPQPPSRPAVTALAGTGAVGPGSRLAMAFHGGVRVGLVSIDASDYRGTFLLGLGDRWSLAADVLGQGGGGNWLAGVSAVARWDPAPRSWPVRPYLLVGSAGVYLGELTSPDSLSLGVGYGQGFGVEVPVGPGAVLLEMRVVSVRPGSGGGVPVSLGYRF